jgi:hypothetical protein
LRQLICSQILFKHRKVLDLRQSMHIRCHRVIRHQWTTHNFLISISFQPPHPPSHTRSGQSGAERHNILVFSNIIISTRLLIHIVALKPAIRQVFLVQPPAHPLGLEQVHNSLFASGETHEVIICDPVRGSSNGSYIVRLRGVSDSEVVSQSNALRC